MNGVDVLKLLAQDYVVPEESRTIGKEELQAMLRAKSAEIKARVLRRVGREIQSYLMVLAVIVVVLFLRHGISAQAMAGIAVLALSGLTIAALKYKEYRIRSLPVHGTVMEVLINLITAIDSLTRLYMTAYMASMVIVVALWEAFVAWRWGLGLGFLAGLFAGIAVVTWCYLSGRQYLEQTFGRYRVELANSLRELESA